MLKWGINVNPCVPNALSGSPLDVADLRYVRKVVIAEELGESLDKALGFYQPLVARYAQARSQIREVTGSNQPGGHLNTIPVLYPAWKHNYS